MDARASMVLPSRWGGDSKNTTTVRYYNIRGGEIDGAGELREIAAYASYRPLEWQIEDGAGKASQGKDESA